MPNFKDFSCIREISPDDVTSWRRKCFLSFDTDWANDEVVRDCYDLVSKYMVKSTWFVTHESSALQFLENDSLIEVGIHPNFNKLLSAEPNESDSRSILEALLSVIPKAKSIRSHSLAQSERLLDQFSELGLSHVSNTFIPYSSGIEIRPFYDWNKTVIVPHIWQDNVALKMDLGFPDFLTDQMVNVFDFHPIHVFLNTENLDRYENTRHLHHTPHELVKHRFCGFGTRSRLIELLESSKLE